MGARRGGRGRSRARPGRAANRPPRPPRGAYPARPPASPPPPRRRRGAASGALAGVPWGRSGAPHAPPRGAVAGRDGVGGAGGAALSRAEPVLTETMAELYLRQGRREDGRRVYKALLAKRPAD